MTTPYDEQISFLSNSDTDQDEEESIEPIHDNEAFTADVIKRPTEIARQRDETLRREANDQRYFSDYDRALLLDGGGKLSVVSGTIGFILTAELDLWVYPALTPGQNSGGRWLGGRVFVADRPYIGVAGVNDLVLTASSTYTGQRGYADGVNFDGSALNPAITLGANGITVEIIADPARSGGVGTISATLSGNPKRKLRITFGTLTPTALSDLVTFINSDGTSFDSSSYGCRHFIRASIPAGTPPTNPAPVCAESRMRGAYDAEAHQVTLSQLSAFFAIQDNELREGEGLAIGYVPGPVEKDTTPYPKGGRRQSLWDLPTDRIGGTIQNTTPGAGYCLFNTGREPEKIPGSIPIGKMLNGVFVAIDGTRIPLGASIYLGESVAIYTALADTSVAHAGAGLIGYSGSLYYNDFTSDDPALRRLAPGTVKQALDDGVANYGSPAAIDSGIRRIGAEAQVGSPTVDNEANRVDLATGSLRQQLLTLLNGVNRRVSENGHFLKGPLPIVKSMITEAPVGGGEVLRGDLLSYGNLAYVIGITAANLVFSAWQPIEYNDLVGNRVDLFEPVEHITGNINDVNLCAVDIAARWAVLRSTLPVPTTTTVIALPVPVSGVPVYHVAVYLHGVTGPGGVSVDGIYYVGDVVDGTHSARLYKLDTSIPDFSVCTFTSATVTFLGTTLIGSDLFGTRIRAHHAGNTAFASLTSRNILAPLLEHFIRDPIASVTRRTMVLYPGYTIWQLANGGPLRNSENILIDTDKQLLDGNEPGGGGPVDASTNHHHDGRYSSPTHNHDSRYAPYMERTAVGASDDFYLGPSLLAYKGSNGTSWGASPSFWAPTLAEIVAAGLGPVGFPLLDYSACYRVEALYANWHTLLDTIYVVKFIINKMGAVLGGAAMQSLGLTFHAYGLRHHIGAWGPSDLVTLASSLNNNSRLVAYNDGTANVPTVETELVYAIKVTRPPVGSIPAEYEPYLCFGAKVIDAGINQNTTRVKVQLISIHYGSLEP